MKTCPNCGAEFKDNSGFCHSCGYDVNYNAAETDYDYVETDEEMILPEEVSELEKKHEHILGEGILSLFFSMWIFPIGFVLGIKNLNRVKEFQKTEKLQGKALAGYILSKIAKIVCIVWFAMLGLVAVMMISALLQ